MMKKKDKSRVGSQSGLSPDHHGAVSGPYGGSPEPKSFTGPIVQKIFAESAGLGIKFGARTNLVKVEGIVDDSQAARVGGLVSGMILIGVQNLSVRGYPFKQALELMKTAGRPLCLTFVDTSKLADPASSAALDECVNEWQTSIKQSALKSLPSPRPRVKSLMPQEDDPRANATPEPQDKTSTRPRSPTTAAMFDRTADGREMPSRLRARSRSTGCLDSVLDESFKRSDLEQQVAELQKMNLKLLKANFVLQNTLGPGHDDHMTDVLEAQTDKYVEYLRGLPATVKEKSKALQGEVRSNMNEIRLMLDAKEEMLMNEIREVEKLKIERIQEDISATITGVRSASNRFKVGGQLSLSPNSRYQYRVVIQKCDSLGYGMELSDPGVVVRGLKCFDDGRPGPASESKVKLGSQIKEVNGISVDSVSKLNALLRQLNTSRGVEPAVEFCFDERRCFEQEGSVDYLKPTIDLDFKLTLDLSLFQEQLGTVNFEEAVSRETVNLSLLRKEKQPANVIKCMSRFSDNVEVQRVGCCLLCNMTLHPENRQLIAESNGVQLLVNLLEHNDSAVVCAALRSVTNLCSDDAYRSAVTNGVGIGRITHLLEAEDNLVLSELAHTISKLCSCAPETRAPVMHGVPASCALIHDEYGMSIQLKGNKPTLNMTGGRRGSLAPEDGVAELQRICQKMRQCGLLAKLLALLFSPDSINKRTHAANCIAVIARDEESAAIVHRAGAVKPLVEMLETNDDNPAAADIQISAASALSALSAGNAASAGDDDRRIEICDAGGLKQLTRLLNSENGEVCLHAAWALKNVCINQHNKTVFARMHGIVPLAKLLISTHHRVLKYTLWALAIVGINKENSQEICKAGAIPLILGLLKSSDDTIQQYAAGALMTLSTNPANQQVIITVGGISRLVEVLSTRVESDNQYDFQLCTMCTLVQIAKSKFSEKNAIAKADGIPAIVRLVSSKKDYISMKAMTSIDYLIKAYPENKGAIVLAGAVPKLLTCAASHSQEVGNLAVKALSLLLDNEEAKRSFSDAAGVPAMVKLLHTEGFDATSQICASTVLVCAVTVEENLVAFVECGGFEVLTLLLHDPATLESALRDNITTILTHALYYEKVNTSLLKPDVKRIVTATIHQAAESFSSSDIKNKASTIVKNWKKAQKTVQESQTELMKKYGNASACFDTEDSVAQTPLPARATYSATAFASGSSSGTYTRGTSVDYVPDTVKTKS